MKLELSMCRLRLIKIYVKKLGFKEALIPFETLFKLTKAQLDAIIENPRAIVIHQNKSFQKAKSKNKMRRV